MRVRDSVTQAERPTGPDLAPGTAVADGRARRRRDHAAILLAVLAPVLALAVAGGHPVPAGAVAAAVACAATRWLLGRRAAEPAVAPPGVARLPGRAAPPRACEQRRRAASPPARRPPAPRRAR